MKILLGFLGLVFLLFQYHYWVGEGSVRSLNNLQQELAAQQRINDALEERNRRVEVEILDLKNGLEAVEERARSELGMIAEGETFYMLVPEDTLAPGVD